jgi:hypothetical protein
LASVHESKLYAILIVFFSSVAASLQARDLAGLPRLEKDCSVFDAGTSAGRRFESSGPLDQSITGNLGFPVRYRRGANLEGRKSNDQISCRYRHLGRICRRASAGATAYGAGTDDARKG